MNETTDRTPTLAEPRYIDRLEDCFFYHTIDLPGFGLSARIGTFAGDLMITLAASR